ncbi:MAG: NAD(P)H-hydrate dehydratase [Pseudomonadota bacterium]
MALPAALYSVAQVREMERSAIAAGTPGYSLMKRAGEGALRVLRSRWPTAMHIAVVCGGGNNGGDGYVLARFAQAAGLTVTVLAASDTARLRGEAKAAHQDLIASHIPVHRYTQAALLEAEVIVDALLGIGATAPLSEPLQAVIREMNACGRPIFSLDLPSGLDGDSGVAAEPVRASATVSFVALKTGLMIGDGPEYTGALHFDDLEIAVPDERKVPPRLIRLMDTDIAQALPRRARSAHKASFGRVLIIGGGVGMPGAVRLAGEAALRAGAGLVSVASRPEHLAAVVGACPELMFHALGDAAPLAELLRHADVVAMGPGLGRSEWSQQIFSAVLAQRPAGQPLVVDADALNLLAALPTRQRCDDWILTPHPGEAGRLLGQTAAQVQKDRLGALETLVAERGGIVVLKGAGTLLGAAGRRPALCERGNPGMAIPGMGDVLTGTIAGFLAQCRDTWLGARAAVMAHACAGDSLARSGERGLLASEVVRELRNWVNR